MRHFIATILLLQATLDGASEVRAVFDIGSGKSKMQVALVDEVSIEALYCQSEKNFPAGINFVDGTGVITREGEECLVRVLKELKSKAERYGPIKHEGFATELFRSAPNGSEVARRISSQLDFDISVISAEEEGIMGFLTVVQEGGLDPERVVVLDIGSGSYQITCKQGGAFFVHSVPYTRCAPSEFIRDVLPVIKQKIADCEYSIIGIGAHPKRILEVKSEYDQSDVKLALEKGTKLDADYSRVALVKAVMDSLSIAKVTYLGGKAGNTSGYLLAQRPCCVNEQ